MSEETTLIGNDFKFQLGDGASPPAFSDFCAVFDVGEIGEESSLVDITTLCDDAMRYRSGLPDGLEIPLQTNGVMQDTQIRALYAAYRNNTLLTFRLTTKEAPIDSFEFSAIVRGWRISPPVNEKAVFNFILKVSGGVEWNQSAIS